MAFSESLKSKIRKRAHFTCCLCRKTIGVDIHHIIPQEECGPDTEENAAPLCPTCHRIYGANKNERKMIKEARESWFEICDQRFINLESISIIMSDYEKIKTDLTNTKQRLKDVEEKISQFDTNKNLSPYFRQSIFYKKLKKLLPINSSFITQAKLYMQQKQYDKAIEALEREIEKNPKSEEGYYLIGLLHGEEGHIDLMMEAYNKSLGISNKFAKNIKGNRQYYWASSFNKGVSYFNKASKANDADSTKMYFSKSIESFTFATLCEPDSVDTYNNLAFAFVNMGESEKALAPVEKQTELYKKKFNLTSESGPLSGVQYTSLLDSYALQGELLTKLGLATEDKDKKNEYYNKAIEKMQEAKKYFPDDPSILLHLSNAYIATDRLDIAMDSFKEGVEKDPENKYYRFNYGSMLLNINDFEKAAEQLQKAVDIDPDYENAIYNLAVTYVKWGATLREDAIKAEKEEEQTYIEKYKLALPYLEKYVQIKPKEKQFWDLLFKVYTNLDMNEGAIEALKKYEELDKGNKCY